QPYSPVTVTASHTLTNGSIYTFNATYQRQRPALLLNNGINSNNTIYAAFGSFCDYSGNNSRGWLLGWNANTLAPLPTNHLDDSQATSPNNFFLSSIWMSGWGIASTGPHLYFSTGNSDAASYNGVTDIQESVVQLNTDLSLGGIFTPSNHAALDRRHRCEPCENRGEHRIAGKSGCSPSKFSSHYRNSPSDRPINTHAPNPHRQKREDQ